MLLAERHGPEASRKYHYSRSNLRVCIFAADVSPVDVFSHLPVQCETNNIPYIFIRSRLELGRST